MDSEGKIAKFLSDRRENLIADLQTLISFSSIQGEPEEDKPFGLEVDRCLKAFLQRAQEMEMRTENLEGYAGTVEIGNGDEMLGILCHLDVVPAGNDWDYDPFTGVIDEGKIYGRGTLDNKGPAIASLYAMKAILDLDISLNKRVRLILGTNEESGWEGISYYQDNYEMPDIAFSPDAVYPVIHAEKGILIFDLSFAKTMDSEVEKEEKEVLVKKLTGGNAPNMVPDRASALVEGNYNYLQQKIDEYEKNQGGEIQLNKINEKEGEIIFKGVSAHGSLPQDGINAISYLIDFLAGLELQNNDIASFIYAYENLIGKQYFAENIGCQMEDEVSGKLVFNVGQIATKENEVRITVNIRYPVTYQAEDVYSGMKDKIKEAGWQLTKREHKKPLYVEKEDILVKDLMAVYKEVTGDEEAEPIAIGGGTYARAVPKGVAFGPLFPGQPELAHQKNEFIEIKDLLLNTEILFKAIIKLAGEN